MADPSACDPYLEAPMAHRVRNALRRLQDVGPYRRPLDFPVEIADASR